MMKEGADRMRSVDTTQAANAKAFRRALPRLLRDPLMRSKYIVIYDRKVRGAFDTFGAALRAGASQFRITD